jgi:hypothetical protein
MPPADFLGQISSCPVNGSRECAPDDRLRRGIQYAAAFEGDSNCHGVLHHPRSRMMTVVDGVRVATEQKLRFSGSVRQDDLSVASRLPVLSHYRPSRETHQERFHSGPLRDIPPTSDGSLMTVGFVVVLQNVAQSAAVWLAGSQTRWRSKIGAYGNDTADRRSRRRAHGPVTASMSLPRAPPPSSGAFLLGDTSMTGEALPR